MQVSANCVACCWHKVFAKLQCVVSCASLAGQDEHRKILQDFHSARAFMSLEVTTKQSYFTSLPWVAAGIAVSIYNEEQGREHARKVLYSFDEVCRKHGPQLTALLHHRVSRLWLHHDSPWRHEINSFVQGQRLKELRRLSRFCGEMILIPIVERRQEGVHSKLSKSHVQLIVKPSSKGRAGVFEIRDPPQVILRLFQTVQQDHGSGEGFWV